MTLEFVKFADERHMVDAFWNVMIDLDRKGPVVLTAFNGVHSIARQQSNSNNCMIPKDF